MKTSTPGFVIERIGIHQKIQLTAYLVESIIFGYLSQTIRKSISYEN